MNGGNPFIMDEPKGVLIKYQKTRKEEEYFMKKKLIAVALMVSMALTACGTTGKSDSVIDNASSTETSSTDDSASSLQEGTQENTNEDAQTLTVNIESEPTSLSSLLATDGPSMNVIRHVEEGLIKLDDNNQVIPGIAESFDVSEDNLTYTFHLRDAKWSNGEEVTANDFLFAWKTILAPDAGAPYAYLLFPIKGAKEYNTGDAQVDALGVTAQDDKTLVVTLEQPIPYFIFLCSQTSYLPINEAFYNDIINNGGSYASDADKILYNGAFTISSWNHENDIILSKNENYYDSDNIKLNTIHMLMVNDSTTAYNMFTTGQLDTVTLYSGDFMKQAENAGYKVLTKSNGATEYLEFNTKDSVLSNKNIRKALSYSIDRETLVNNVLNDSSTPALSFTNPSILATDGTVFKDKVGDLVKDNDVTAAKEALEQGMKELGLTELPTITLTIDDRDSVKLKAAALQEFWNKNLGINVEIESMTYKSKMEAMNAGDFQINISGWGPDYNDPMTFLEMFESNSGTSNCGYSSEEYDALIDQAKKETDMDKRTQLLVQAEKLLFDDTPIATLDFSNRAYVVADHVKNVFRSSFQDLDLINAYKE